jgi:uracil-DNA glycosylase family 4
MRNLFPQNTFVSPQYGSSSRLVIAEAPGQQEAVEGQPLCGGSGEWYNAMLGKAGIKRDSLTIINTIQCRPPDNIYPTDSEARKYISAEDARKVVQHCYKAHVEPILKSRPWTRVDLLGEKALQIVGKKYEGVYKWRGSPIPVPDIDSETPLAIATLHPAAIARDQAMLPVVVNDFRKDLNVPAERYKLFPSLEEVRAFIATEFAADIETPRAGHPWEKTEIGIVGLSARSCEAIVVPFRGAYIDELKRIFANAKTIVTQNGLQFDLPVLEKFGVVAPQAEQLDVMLLHHLRFPSLPHDLEFIASQLTSKPAWKHEKGIFELYNARDTDVTWQIYKALRPMVEQAGLMDIYKLISVPLAKICYQMYKTGFKIDPSQITKVREKLLQEMAQLELALPEEMRTFYVTKRRRQEAPPGTLNSKNRPVKYVYVEEQEPVVPWRSTSRKQAYLYHTEEPWQLGLPAQIDPKKKTITTGKVALDKLKKRIGDSPKVKSLPKAERPPVEQKIQVALSALKKLNQIDETITTFCKEEMLTTARMHPHFNVHGTSTGRLSSSEPNCFDGETEVLTREGWIRLDSLPREIEVAQWSTDSRISFVKPLAYIVQEADRFIHLTNQHIDLCVTEDHRCLTRHRKTGQLSVHPAIDYPADRRQIHAGFYRDGRGIDLTNDELVVLCAVQADGSYDGRRIDFTFSRSRKIQRLTEALTQAGISFQQKPRGEQTRIRIVSWDAVDKIKQFLGKGKTFGPWVLDCSEAQLDFLCQEIFNWDGSYTRQNTYSSSVRVNADWIQIAHTLRGSRAKVRVYMPPSGRPNYQVDITDRDYSGTAGIEREIKTGAFTAYCLSVPSSFLLVRRNGRVCVTGQCQNIPEASRVIYVPSHRKWKILSVDFSGIENRLTAWFANDKKRQERLADPEFSEHKYLTSLVEKIPYDQVVKDKDPDSPYSKAKHVCHGSDRAMGALKMSQMYDMDIREVKRLLAMWKEEIKETVSWQVRVGELVRQQGFLTNPFERKIWLWTSSSYTEGISFMPQSTGFDVLARVMIGLCWKQIGWPEELVKKVVRVYEPLPEPTRLLLSVHDELDFEYPEEIEKPLIQTVKKVMLQPWPELGGMVLPISISTSPSSWGELETYKEAA